MNLFQICNDDFEFTATFEIFPEVKDIDVKKINITDYETEVKEKDVNKTIDTYCQAKKYV